MTSKLVFAFSCVVAVAVAQDNGYGYENGYAKEQPTDRFSYESQRAGYNYDKEGGESGGEIPGEPDKDYPVFREVPETRFDCNQQEFPGYYADPEARCQVFHICQRSGRRDSFLCPNGTLFNQETLVCDWWTNFDCSRATSLYSINEAIARAAEEVDRMAAETKNEQGYGYRSPTNFHDEKTLPIESGPRSDFDTVVVEAAQPSPVRQVAQRVTRPVYDVRRVAERQRFGSYETPKSSQITGVEFKNQVEDINQRTVPEPALEYLPGKY